MESCVRSAQATPTLPSTAKHVPEKAWSQAAIFELQWANADTNKWSHHHEKGAEQKLPGVQQVSEDKASTAEKNLDLCRVNTKPWNVPKCESLRVLCWAQPERLDLTSEPVDSCDDFGEVLDLKLLQFSVHLRSWVPNIWMDTNCTEQPNPIMMGSDCLVLVWKRWSEVVW